MRYLKGINEKLSDDFISDLKEFCETHLAYLLDDDFSIGYRVYHNTDRNQIHLPYIEITIKSTKISSNEYPSFNKSPFSWKDVSDHIIPFIHFLNIKYCITQKTSYYGTGIVCIETPTPDKIKKTTFKVEDSNYLHYLGLSDIESNNIKPDTKIKYIEITIAGYKYIPK